MACSVVSTLISSWLHHTLFTHSPRFSEGGVNAQTYCAPQNAKCARAAGLRVDSEQDFQGRAHGILRRSAPDSIFRFRFITGLYNGQFDPATEVSWISNGVPSYTPVSKRDEGNYDNVTVEIVEYHPPVLGEPYRITHSIHLNGTESVAYSPLTHQEVWRFFFGVLRLYMRRGL